jgi:HEAT repeat protein
MSENKFKAPLKALLETIEDPRSTSDQMCEAAQNIAELGDERAKSPLLNRLTQYKDPPWVRSRLVLALGSIVLRGGLLDVRVADVLLEILSSVQEDSEVKASAAIALGQIGEERAVEPFLSILNSKQQPDLAYACIAALGDIGNPKVIGALVEYLKSDKLLIPQTAAKSLAKFGKAAEQALPNLKELADHGNEVERQYAREAIASIAGEAETGSAGLHH